MGLSKDDIAKLTAAAENGHTDAQYHLGLMYASGEQIDLDYVSAARWIGEAAGKGHTNAMITLAWLYENGYGLEQDERSAGAWYLAAAEAGSTKGAYMLGVMYQFGRLGVEKDTAAMLKWFQFAADKGLPSAQFALGKISMEGKHVPRDEQSAFQWLSLASVHGNERALKLLQELMQQLGPDRTTELKNSLLDEQNKGTG